MPSLPLDPGGARAEPGLSSPTDGEAGALTCGVGELGTGGGPAVVLAATLGGAFLADWGLPIDEPGRSGMVACGAAERKESPSGGPWGESSLGASFMTDGRQGEEGEGARVMVR